MYLNLCTHIYTYIDRASDSGLLHVHVARNRQNKCETKFNALKDFVVSQPQGDWKSSDLS